MEVREKLSHVASAAAIISAFSRRFRHPRPDMGLTISSIFARLFGNKQMRILMGEFKVCVLLTVVSGTVSSFSWS